jgi:TPR repeat protein
MRLPVALLALALSLDAHAQGYERALELERSGQGAEAVRLYILAARAGSGKAAGRLAEIYETGAQGVARDYAESLKWRNAARILGVPMIGDFPTKSERERDGHPQGMR